MAVAAFFNILLEHELKTLILSTSVGLIAVSTNASRRVDLRAVKRHLRSRQARLASPDELRFIGLRRGTVTPIQDPVYSMRHLVDSGVFECEWITTNDGTLTGYVVFEPAQLLTCPGVERVDDLSFAPLYARKPPPTEEDMVLKKQTARVVRRPHVASHGIMGVHFADSRSPSREFSDFVKEALGRSTEAEQERRYLKRYVEGKIRAHLPSFGLPDEFLSPPSGYRILDTFFSDSAIEIWMGDLVKLLDGESKLTILLADPYSEFAKARVRALDAGASSIDYCRDGLVAVCKTLEEKRVCDRIRGIDDFGDFVREAKVIAEKANIDIKFYSRAASGPMMFFQDILVCGRYWADKTATKRPWLMVVDDPFQDHDLFDEYNNEFESLAEQASPYPNPLQQAAGVGVFVSHGSSDLATAKELQHMLTKSSVPAFLAPVSLRGGDEWEPAIRQAIANCAEMVVLVSPESMSSEWVELEASAAWQLRKRITPAELARSPRISPALRSSQFVPYQTAEERQSLVKAIAKRLAC